jgi:hypothetical protein
MVTSDAPTPDPNLLVYPRDACPGALGTFTKQSRWAEIGSLEVTRQLRAWEVRAFISDTVPLAGDAAEALSRSCHHKFFINQSPLFLYLHEGSRRAVYYELVGDEDNKLAYIAVRVESCLPSNALLVARRPINALLDVLTRDLSLPLAVQRLDLMSPTDGAVLLSEMLIPARNGVVFGPIGGIVQATPFAQYDALYREALTNPSPFYRLLCAWKMYEGTSRLRRELHERCVQKKIVDRLPPDPDVDPQELIRIGLDPTSVSGIKKAADLFNLMAVHRNAIAHFLIEKDGNEGQVYLADGRHFIVYAVGASALLRCAHRVLEDLRSFYMGHPALWQGGVVMVPLPENRDQFVVRARDYGLE